jgi:hypothetical protein
MNRGLQPTRGPTPGACVAPRSLVLNLTLQCPLRCGHCCYRSDMSQHGCMGIDEARRAIDDAARIDTLHQVQFVGGDPFLLPDLMREALLHAQGYGIEGTATTSAFWARSTKRAQAILAPLVDAGLAELIVSYDDAHAEFVPMRNVEAAVAAARTFGLRIYVAVTLDVDARIDAAHLRTVLGIPEGHPREKVYEVVVNGTGRAADNDVARDTSKRRNDERAYRGACHSALQNIQVTDDGRILPCCGVLPHNDAMAIGRLDRGDRVDEAVAAAYQDPLWTWIALEGPVEVLAQATAGTDAPLQREDFDGICSACERLFNSPELMASVRAALVHKQEYLAQHIGVLEALELWRPPASPVVARAAPAPKRTIALSIVDH